MEESNLLTVIAEKMNVTIKEDESFEMALREKLAQEYSRLREETHVADLILCMRQALFRKLYPLPPTQKQLGYFFDGERRHEALQKLYGEGASEKEGRFEGVHYTIDIYNDLPIKFKTTRARRAISEHWLRQLVYYMLATDSSIGILQVQRIMPNARAKDENLFPSFLVELNKKQRKFWLNDFMNRKEKFTEAFSAKDPSKAPIYRGENSWICRECPYKNDCDAIESSKGKAGD